MGQRVGLWASAAAHSWLRALHSVLLSGFLALIMPSRLMADEAAWAALAAGNIVCSGMRMRRGAGIHRA